MPGQIRRMIDTIIEQRSKGSAVIASTTRTKLVLKGISPDAYTASSPDDPNVIAKLHAAAAEFGVRL